MCLFLFKMKISRKYRVIFCIALLFSMLVASFYMIINSRRFQFFGKIISRVNTNRKIVALTFDDGPSVLTASILDTLSHLGIKATFFVVGEDLSLNMDKGRMIVNSGHALGNHSWSHSRLIFSSFTAVKHEVERTDSAIRVAGYKGEIYFRPPYGKKLFSLPYYLYRHKRTTVMWDVEPEGSLSSSAQIVEETVRSVHPGSIILLHAMVSSREASRAAIGPIVRKLQEMGYGFVTVDELVAGDNL